jgi:hypothetical protein
MLQLSLFNGRTILLAMLSECKFLASQSSWRSAIVSMWESLKNHRVLNERPCVLAIYSACSSQLLTSILHLTGNYIETLAYCSPVTNYRILCSTKWWSRWVLAFGCSKRWCTFEEQRDEVSLQSLLLKWSWVAHLLDWGLTSLCLQWQIHTSSQSSPMQAYNLAINDLDRELDHLKKAFEVCSNTRLLAQFCVYVVGVFCLYRVPSALFRVK